MLGAPSSQPTVPFHELSPARLVLHRQSSAHGRRKGTRECSIEVGHFSVFIHPALLTVDNGRALHPARATRRLMLGREVATLLYAEFWARNY